ncbi:MAG: rRNA maturation RNase YbeY [Spirochaetaceae bacterium]
MCSPIANSVDVSSESVEPPSWLPAVEGFVLRVLERLGITGWELSILFCDDSFIHNLNATYRGIEAPTDVLSFSQTEGPGVDHPLPPSTGGGRPVAAGDIVISLDTLNRQSAEYHVDLEEELKRLLVHGILHLAGHDHGETHDDGDMMGIQEGLLSQLTEEHLF